MSNDYLSTVATFRPRPYTQTSLEHRWSAAQSIFRALFAGNVSAITPLLFLPSRPIQTEPRVSHGVPYGTWRIGPVDRWGTLYPVGYKCDGGYERLVKRSGDGHIVHKVRSSDP